MSRPSTAFSRRTDAAFLAGARFAAARPAAGFARGDGAGAGVAGACGAAAGFEGSGGAADAATDVWDFFGLLEVRKPVEVADLVFFSGWGVPAAVFAVVLRAAGRAAFALASDGGAGGLPVDESGEVDEVFWDIGCFLAIYQCVFL
jgi:hypothetical protein